MRLVFLVLFAVSSIAHLYYSWRDEKRGRAITKPLLLLFLALSFKIVKVSQIKEVSGFLTVFMSVLFVPPAVNLMEHWSVLAPDLIPIVLTVFISTVLVFTVSGLVTRLLSKKEER